MKTTIVLMLILITGCCFAHASDDAKDEDYSINYSVYGFLFMPVEDFDIDNNTKFIGLFARAKEMSLFIARQDASQNGPDAFNIFLWRTLWNTYHDKFYIATGINFEESPQGSSIQGALSLGYNVETDNQDYLFGGGFIVSYNTHETFRLSMEVYGPIFKGSGGDYLSIYVTPTILKFDGSDKLHTFLGVGIGYGF